MTSTMGVLLDRAGVELPLSDLANLWPLGGWNSVAPVPGGKNEHLRVAAGEGVHYLRRSYRSKPQAELAGQRVPKRRLERDDVELAAELLAAPAIGEAMPASLRAVIAGSSRNSAEVASRWSSWSASVAPDLEALQSVVSTALSRR